MGIDYGRGIANIDHATGIRYGCVVAHRVGYLYDEAEPEYPDLECECGHDFGQDYSDGDECPECGATVDLTFWEPISWNVDSDDIKGYFDDTGDFIILWSKWKVRDNFASPCFPGGVYIDEGTGDDAWAYCPPPDCFEDDDRPDGIVEV